MWGGEIMNLIDNISIILKIVSKLQMLSFYGCSKWDGMVITGHRYSKSTFGANNWKKETPFLNQVNLDILKFLIVQLNSSAPGEGHRIVVNSKD